MRKVIRFYTGLLFCLALFTSAVSFAGEVNVKKLSKKTWIRVESANFVLLSDAGLKKSIGMLKELEDFSYFTSRILGYKKKKLAKKVTVILSKNSHSFKALGMLRKTSNVFIKGSDVIFARNDRFRPSSNQLDNLDRAVILRAVAYLLIDNASLNIAMPAWFNNGIAEYLSTYKRSKNEITLGDMTVLVDSLSGLLKPAIPIESLNFDRSNRSIFSITSFSNTLASIDTESLFKATHTNFNVFEESTKEQHQSFRKIYATAIGTVHYLYAEKERREAVYFYLVLLKKGYGVDEAFKHAFKMTFTEFDEKIEKYLIGNSAISVAFPIGSSGIEFPEVETKAIETTRRENMNFLYKNISLLSDNILGKGNREKMNADFESLYPDFFDE